MTSRPRLPREILAFLGPTALALAGLGCVREPLPSPTAAPALTPLPGRPNVVFVLVDDLRFDALAIDGHPFVETPNLDRLAREGARFSNAFVTTSLCCPSRASLFTGLYAHRHGVTRNDEIDLDPALVTFPKLLQAAGWRTAFIGKWHMGPGAEPRPGFDRWVSFEGQGVYFDPLLNEDGREVQAKGYVTDLLTDEAVRWIGEQTPSKPFCLFLSHKATHAPMAPAARHRGRYAEREIALPPATRDDLAGAPEALRRMVAHGFHRRDFEARAAEPVPERIPPPAWTIADFVRAYLETVLSVDESVGHVVAALEDRGLLEDTLLVFTSDNGYLFGEHQSPDKRLAYEESMHVPLLVRSPRFTAPGTVVDELVLNVDLAPTLLDLAGLPAAEGLQGRSLAPLLAGERVPWRDSFLYEYFREPPMEGIPTTLALRTKNWKYVVYPDYLEPNEELFDLGSDRNELRNLAGSPGEQARLADLRAQLARAQEETGFAWPAGLEPLAFESAPEELAFDLDAPAASAPVHVAWREGACFSLRLSLSTERGEGTLLSAGNALSGFALRLEDGRPVFELRSQGRVRVARASRSIAGRHTELEMGLDLDGRAFLAVDGGEPTPSSLRIPEPLGAEELELTLGAGASSALERLEIVWTGSRTHVRR